MFCEDPSSTARRTWAGRAAATGPTDKGDTIGRATAALEPDRAVLHGTAVARPIVSPSSVGPVAAALPAQVRRSVDEGSSQNNFAVLQAYRADQRRPEQAAVSDGFYDAVRLVDAALRDAVDAHEREDAAVGFDELRRQGLAAERHDAQARERAADARGKERRRRRDVRAPRRPQELREREDDVMPRRAAQGRLG